MFPASDLGRADVVVVPDAPRRAAGRRTRVLFDPGAATYAHYELDSVDPSVDVAAFLANSRIAEIGRFAVVPERRNGMGAWR